MQQEEGFVEELRKGSFVTLTRIRNYAWIMVVFNALSLVALIVRAHGLLEPDGQPIGADFVAYYSAGTISLKQQAADAYIWATQHGMEKTLFGAATPFYPWVYPPLFLFVASGLALFPYPVALAIWVFATLALYLYSIRAIVTPIETKYWLPIALGFSAVMINAANGQNGFLSAFLFGTGLALLEKRPLVAGLLLGALSYKPQFGLLLPLALMVGGHWRVFLGAALSVLALSALSTAWYGTESWLHFFASLGPAREAILDQGVTGLYKIQTLFATLKLWGVPSSIAYGAQTIFGVGVAVAVLWLWRRSAHHALKAAALLTGSLLITPYGYDYDLVILGPAIAFCGVHGMKHGFAPYTKTLLSWCWFMPLFLRPVIDATHIPVGFLSVLLLFSSVFFASYNNTCSNSAQPVKQ